MAASPPRALPILEFPVLTSPPRTSQQQQQQPTTSYKLLTHNIISVLEKVGSCPFAAYCMSGRSRIGKSYTLNYFIRSLLTNQNQQQNSTSRSNSVSAHEFKWRKGTERETVGINLWSEPYFTTHRGQRIAILLMDAQGLFDAQTTMQQNSVIFALCGLLSSVCIFNVSQKLEFDALQNVNFFTEYARAIGHKRNNEGGIDDDSEGFQRLVIMVRDYDDPDEFGFGYHDNHSAPQNTAGGYRNYYHEKLSGGDNGRERSFEYDAVVKGIRDNYESIGIILHPDPGTRFRRDPLNNQPDSEYLEKTDEFVKLMVSERYLVTKTIDGRELTGRDFIPFVQHLGVICENAKDHFPSAQTIADSAAIMANELALTTAYQLFSANLTRFMRSDDNAGDSAVEAVYRKTLEEANTAFGKIKKLGGKIKEDEYRGKLVEKCEAKFERMREVFCLKRESRRQMKLNAEAIARLNKEKEALRKQGQETSEAFKKLQRETNSLSDTLRQGQAKFDQLEEKLRKSQRYQSQREEEMDSLRSEMEALKRKSRQAETERSEAERRRIRELESKIEILQRPRPRSPSPRQYVESKSDLEKFGEATGELVDSVVETIVKKPVKVLTSAVDVINPIRWFK